MTNSNIKYLPNRISIKIVSFENNKSFAQNFEPQNHVACDKKNEIVASKKFVELVQRL
jgi:hypothetical protein